MYSNQRIKKNLHQKVKDEAVKKNNSLIDMYSEIINFYFYHKENELDHTIERYLHNKFEKLDYHLSTIMIKNAKDTCSNFMATRDMFRMFHKYVNQSEKSISEDEAEKEFERLGMAYFNRKWRTKNKND